MYRLSGLLRVLSIWLIVTVTQSVIFISTITESRSIMTPAIVIGITTALFGLIVYGQDRELKKAEEKSKVLKKKLDDMFDI